MGGSRGGGEEEEGSKLGACDLPWSELQWALFHCVKRQLSVDIWWPLLFELIINTVCLVTTACLVCFLIYTCTTEGYTLVVQNGVHVVHEGFGILGIILDTYSRAWKCFGIKPLSRKFYKSFGNQYIHTNACIVLVKIPVTLCLRKGHLVYIISLARRQS